MLSKTIPISVIYTKLKNVSIILTICINSFWHNVDIISYL